MTRHAADLGIRTGTDRHSPDDLAEDVLGEMTNFDTQDTNVPGTIFVSTELGSHGPRVEWYPGRAGRALPCLIVSIAADPKVRDDFVRTPASRAVAPLDVAWVRLNHAALLDFSTNGASWNRRGVSAFLDSRHKIP